MGLRGLDAGILVLLVLALALYFYVRTNRRAQIFEYAKSEVKRQGALMHQGPRIAVGGLSMLLLKRLGGLIPLLSAGQRAEASTKLVMAGLRSSTAMLTLGGVIVLSCVGMAFLTWWQVWPLLEDKDPLLRWGALAVSLYLGIFLPRLVLDRLVARRQEAIRLALPDALDLLVICTNAGLGLNAAIERVADELFFVAPALADEFRLTANELRLSSDTEQVLKRLVDRTGLDGMRSLVNTFLQARQYGTAITHALRILASSERTARMMRLEEKAAKLAVKMTLPMMVFILPTVLIIGAGPALINLAKFFGSQ
ncbi:type II secretion system F family protein [Castellaniella hirudinis]|uniref:type II secretion system F family protein n=1 Tax=Castellaniella hirudinis TaxID=1144617 RepID=UPI0039C427BD